MSSDYEKQYLNILEELLIKGKLSSNRTGIKTYKLWGLQMHIDLQEGFPVLTTKKLHWKSIAHELLWMISGDTNIQYLLKNGVTFWSEWPYQEYCRPSEDENSASVSAYPPESMRFTQKEFEQTIISNDEFAKKWGSIGRFGYGGLWTKFPFYTEDDEFRGSSGITGEYAESWAFGSVNQLVLALEELKSNPDSRRIIISAWHPYHSNRKEDALLPACHNYVQFGTEELTLGERLRFYERREDIVKSPHFPFLSVEDLDKSFIPKYRLNCYYSMRSNDFFLGNPFNNAFYALFTHLIANQLNMIPGQLVYSAADVHLYENHVEQARLQLTRKPKELPKLTIKTPGKSIFDIKFEDLELTNYNPEPNIKAEVAI